MKESEEYAAIGHRIRDAREAAHMTQAQLTPYLNVSPVELSRMESGKRKITILELQTLAPILNKTLTWLVSGDEGENRALRSTNRHIPPEAMKEIDEFIAYVWTKYNDKANGE